MAAVELQISPLPVHVRTARLVGVAAARRAGLDDDYVADLRLALGEACSRAVALHAEHAPDTPVVLRVRDEPGSLVVEVTDAGPPARPLDDPQDLGDLFDESGSVDPQVALTVLAGLVDDVQVEAGATGTTVVLRWPLAPRVL